VSGLTGRLARAAAAGLAAGLLAALPCRAATLTDPSETVGVGRLRLDGEAEGVLARRVSFEDAARVREVKARNFFLTGNFGILADLDGFVTLGASRLRVPAGDALPTGAFDGDVGFLFGGGLRYRFVDERYFKVGARLAVTRLTSEEADVTATLVEYDLLLGASLHALRDLVPFLALGASLVDGQFTGPFGRQEVRQDDVIGAVAGLRYAATAQVHATVAGRLFDEEAVSFALSFAF
jgi:hypothetical protein